jgi:hypothetical protein
MEEIQDVKMVRVDYKCPECETGYLRPTGMVLTVNPPLFPHMCDNPNCGYGETFNVNYPRIVHEPVEPPLSNDQILEIIVNSINYNNMCARLTLGDLPLVTVEDLKKNWGNEKPGYPSRRNAELP